MEYQNCCLFYIHLEIFPSKADKFSKIFYIDKIIYAKLLTIETNLTDKLTSIIISIIFYSLCKK